MWVEPAKIGIQKNIVISLYTDISIIFRTWGLKKIWMARVSLQKLSCLTTLRAVSIAVATLQRYVAQVAKAHFDRDRLRMRNLKAGGLSSWVLVMYQFLGEDRRFRGQGCGNHRLAMAKTEYLRGYMLLYVAMGDWAIGPLLSLESGSWDKSDCLFCFGEVEAVS